MSLRREIKTTFDSIHAPENLVEHMKQELYQKDFHDEEEDAVTGVAPAPRRSFRRFFLYAAACALVCVIGVGSVLSLRDHQNHFNPGTHVVFDSSAEEAPEPETEETTEAPDSRDE